MIDHARASAIAHGAVPFHNPISQRSIAALLDLLPLSEPDRVVDLGCGRGELLIRIAEQTGAGGFGIDTSEEQIATARREAASRVPAAALRFEAGDARTLVTPAGGFALGACIGSTHALGGLQRTLSRLAELVGPGGYLLVGEGYWAHRPARDVLQAIGGSEEELTDYPSLLEAGGVHRLSPVYAVTASDADWARYEWAYLCNAERYAREHADEQGIELLVERVDWTRRRRLLAARHGETLGFALVLWRRDEPAFRPAGGGAGDGPRR